jgi:crotonobetainyl-CoA:carnitine CoA-transferase CaiB-like acyl-CoA transferase
VLRHLDQPVTEPGPELGSSPPPPVGPATGPLGDLRVLDLSTVLAGPGCARYLADFGADVIKIERPGSGDSVRDMGWRDPRDDVTLFWKMVSRGKRTIVLDLKTPDGLDVMARLCDTADVLVENLRPGKLEALGLVPDDLIARNPRLVITRVTGFGQDGPYASRPGFATLAEAMSGFAAINGEPDGGPLLPPIALTDEVTALVGAFATMVAVHSGVGQVVDVNLFDSLFQMMGPLPAAHALLGYSQPRLGSGIPYSVPRSTYRTADDQWVAISTSAESVARRVLDLVGVGTDQRFHSFAGRVAHRAELDEAVGQWIGARRLADVLAAFEDAHAAAAAVLTMADLAVDPHVLARQSIVEVDGVPMQGLIARLSRTPGHIRWAGRPLGADTDEVLAELAEEAEEAEESS